MTPPMNCQESLQRLYEYLDGELTAENAEEVRRHIEICETCYPEVKRTTAFRDAVRRAAQGQPVCPDDLRDKVRGLLKAEGAGGPGGE